MIDFTLNTYKKILCFFIFKKYEIFSVSGYLENDNSQKKCLVLRHDVDRKPLNALNMAKLESEMGISSTYYFRIKKCSLNKEIIRQIHNLGHEIGYHYENLSDCNGNYKKAINNFKSNLNIINKFVRIRSIAMHGSPLSKYNNADLWKKYEYKKYDVENEVNLTIDYSNFYYFTDTGRSWSSSNNLRDFINSKHLICKFNINTSDKLIIFLKKNDKNILLSTHPERWSNNISDYVYQWCLDNLINFVKKIIKLLRKKDSDNK